MAGDLVVGIGPECAGLDAALYAAQLARRAGIALILVFGYDVSTLGQRGGPLEEHLAAIASENTDVVRRQLAGEFPDLVVRVEIVSDHPVDSLIRVAETEEAEAIVVGHGGRGPLRAALLGSTTYELVHRSPIPVLVVPGQAD